MAVVLKHLTFYIKDHQNVRYLATDPHLKIFQGPTEAEFDTMILYVLCGSDTVAFPHWPRKADYLNCDAM